MGLDNKTILLVEDDLSVGQTYERRFKIAGARVIWALNGVDGLQKLKGERVDLILADLMMPKMNGYEMIKRIREDPETKDIPIVILTNLNDRPEDIEKVKQLGVKEYIVKSDISLAELVERVSFHLQNSS